MRPTLYLILSFSFGISGWVCGPLPLGKAGQDNEDKLDSRALGWHSADSLSNDDWEGTKMKWGLTKSTNNFGSPPNSLTTKEYHSEPKKLCLGILGAEFSLGQPKPGVELGPLIVRSTGFIDVLRKEVGHDIKDYGDIKFDNLPSNKPSTNNLKNLDEVATANLRIAQMTSKIVSEGRIPLTIGGDHSIAIGTIQGVASEIKEELAVLWVDAHSDINTVNTTDTGNIHGMSMYFLLKELKNEQQISQFSWIRPRISAANVAYIGLRSVDPGERETLDKLGITAFTMRDVDRLGIVEVTNRALYKITQGGRLPLHLSFDIDVLDDIEIGRNTGTPVAGGLSLRESLLLLEEVYDKARMVSMDLVEVNPSLGNMNAVNRTAEVTKHLLISAFGGAREIPVS